MKNLLPTVQLWLGLSLLAAGTLTSANDDDPVLAIINDYQLRASDIKAQIAKMPLGDQVSIRSDTEKFAESLIQEEVLFQYVLNNSFINEPELRDEIKTLAVNYLIQKYVTDKLDVTDAEIEAFYKDNTSSIRGETIQVSHILTATRDECEQLLQRLENGSSFEDLAKQHSIHQSSAERGGLLGSMMNHDGPLGFETSLFDIPENQPTLFESEDGCHIMMVTGRDTPPLPPLETVAPALESLLMREQEINALESLIESANQQVKVIRPQSE